MTAFAFIFGVLPLMFASGAGAASRQSLGTAVFGGMVAATLLTLIFVPVFYALIERAREGREAATAAAPHAGAHLAPHAEAAE
jgi:HAE1 family hydrophobic/amphiphilic exporter-1